MTTDYRALCAELFAAIQLYLGQNPAAAEIPANQLVSRLMNAMAATAAALEAAGNHPAKPDSSPAPAGGLVERVAEAITDDSADVRLWHYEAGAAILAVAEWFDAIGYGATASILRQELKRG